MDGPSIYRNRQISDDLCPKSLNYNVRKKENDRIEQEN